MPSKRKIRAWSTAAAACCAAACGHSASDSEVAGRNVSLVGTTVFINEFHYDNAGADVDEGIEVAGPAGTDLSGYSLVLYNGNGGAPYNTVALGGVLPDQQGGFGTTAVSLPPNGLQNGGPDGIALVNAAGELLEFLSYEGSFTAVGGPADGALSTDVGVAEASGTAVGSSLQRVGTGTLASDFTWAGPTSASAGAVNAGQTFAGEPDPEPEPEPETGGLFVNEVHYDNAGADVGEAIEVAGPAGTDLTGYSLVLYNGSNGAPYNTLDLGGVLADQLDGFGTAAVELPSNGLQNGAPDGIALVDPDGAVLEFISYEGTLTATAGPAEGLTSNDIGVRELSSTPAGQSLQRTGTGSTGDDFSWTGPAGASFGAPNAGQGFDGDAGPVDPPVVEVCGDAATPIFDIQGSGDDSPLVDNTVSVEAVVVGDFQGSGSLGGFFLQDAAGDGNPDTSDGLFVFQGGLDAEVEVGDTVRVRGTVAEFFGLTQLNELTDLQVCSSGSALAATNVALPVADANDLEAFEGMLVTFEQPLTVTETFNLGRFGELSVSADGRVFNPTNRPFDLADLPAQRDLNARRRLLVDDGRTGQNPEPTPYLAADGTVRLGDTVTGLTGVLAYSFGSYRLQPTQAPVIERDNARTAEPADVGGTLKVASFNVLNYFVTLNERGADTLDELERQQAKILAALAGLDADIVGLVELENGSAAVQDLVAAYNEAAGQQVYTALDPGTVGSDAIRVGVIYKADRVQPVGDFLPISFDGAGDPGGTIGDRQSLAQGFSYQGNRLAVVVNHFKSKGCRNASGDNQDLGQGCYNLRRTAQAQAVLDALPQVQAQAGTDNVIVLGDLNAYSYEDPILALEDGGMDNLLKRFVDEDDSYSFVFSGESGDLDHALVSPSLSADVSGLSIWHINADEPRILDYNTEFNPAGLYQPDAFRASDHDPLLIGLDLQPSLPWLIEELMALTERVAAEANLRPRETERLLKPLRRLLDDVAAERFRWARVRLIQYRTRVQRRRLFRRLSKPQAQTLLDASATLVELIEAQCRR